MSGFALILPLLRQGGQTPGVRDEHAIEGEHADEDLVGLSLIGEKRRPSPRTCFQRPIWSSTRTL